MRQQQKNTYERVKCRKRIQADRIFLGDRINNPITVILSEMEGYLKHQNL